MKKNFLEKRKFIISGGTGFIGTKLCEILDRYGADLYLVVNKTKSYYQNQMTIKQLFEKDFDFQFDGIFHLSTYFNANLNLKFQEIEDLLEANLKFSSQLSYYAYKNKIKNIVITDSFSQYTNEIENQSLYSISKNLSNKIFNYFNSESYKICNLILFDTYGPNDSRNKLLNHIKKSLENNEIIELSPGDQLVDYMYVDDVCEALIELMIRLIKNEISPINTYSLNGYETVSLRSFIEILEEILGNRLRIKWGAKPYRATEIFEPFQLFPAIPNWKPQHSLETGLRKTFFKYL